MNLNNLQKAQDYKVREWIEKELDLTLDQRRKFFEKESIRWAPFEFFEKRKKTKNKFLRITIILVPIVWVFLGVFLPIKFLFSGEWGYNYKHINWFHKWTNNLGL